MNGLVLQHFHLYGRDETVERLEEKGESIGSNYESSEVQRTPV